MSMSPEHVIKSTCIIHRNDYIERFGYDKRGNTDDSVLSVIQILLPNTYLFDRVDKWVGYDEMKIIFH